MLLRWSARRVAVVGLVVPSGLLRRRAARLSLQGSATRGWAAAPQSGGGGGGGGCSEGRPGFPLHIPEVSATAEMVAGQTQRPRRRFIACPDLAHTVAARLNAPPRTTSQEALVLECEPGPGILTRTLLNAGTKVVALESNMSFLPNLEMLKDELDGQLEVVHCDFFKLDPINDGSMKPPVMYSENLFDKLGISAVPWTADIPIKVIGIVPNKRERNQLWKLLYALYDCSSIYKYGRIELNLFVSEKEYKTLIAKPSDKRTYQALSVLWQTACNIQLVHKEPWSSFLINSKKGGLLVPKSGLLQNDHLCLVRLTPRKDLFTNTLTTANSSLFVSLVKQCLAKCKSKVVDKLNLWTCENGKNLVRQLKVPDNSTTGSLYPEQYKNLFELMQQFHEFDESWFYDEDVLEDYRSINF